MFEEKTVITTTRATKRITANGAMRLITGSPPWPSARRCAIALLTSCSIGRKNPGANANAINHIATIGLNPSCPSACWPILKKTYAETPAMNSPMPTVIVPSGKAIFDAVGVESSEIGAVLKQPKVTWCWKCLLLRYQAELLRRVVLEQASSLAKLPTLLAQWLAR